MSVKTPKNPESVWHDEDTRPDNSIIIGEPEEGDGERHDTAEYAAVPEETKSTQALMGMGSFFGLLEPAVANTLDTGAVLSVLMIKVDRLVAHEKLYGREVAKELKRRVSRRITEALGPELKAVEMRDAVYFVVLPSTSATQAIQIGQDLLMVTSRTPIVAQGEQFNITLSVGVATHEPESDDSPFGLVPKATKAMGQAEQGSGNRVWLYS